VFLGRSTRTGGVSFTVGPSPLLSPSTTTWATFSYCTVYPGVTSCQFVGELEGRSLLPCDQCGPLF